MRPRKLKTPKVFEYCDLEADADSWIELSLGAYCDQFDAAEEAAERIWNNGDSDTQEAFSHGLPIVIREKGTENIFGFELTVEFSPMFSVKEKPL
jgi:hypothetical protein